MQVKIYTIESTIIQGKDGSLSGRASVQCCVDGVYQSFNVPKEYSALSAGLEAIEIVKNLLTIDPRQLSFGF